MEALEMLTSDQVTFYRENGYLMVEDAVDAEQLEALRRVTYDFIERSREVSESDQIFDLDEGHSPAQPRLTRIKLPHQQHPIFWDVLRSERMTGVLKDLLGPDIRLHTSKLNTKAPGGGAAVEWHQDWAFYPHTNDDMLAIGLMLEDVDEANGPLMVIPGTHKAPVLSHFTDGVFCGAVDPDDPRFEKDRIVTLTGKAGSMSLHHVRTLHGSAPNRSDRARLIVFYECGAADAWPLLGANGAFMGYTPAGLWHTFNERLICGEQGREPRLAPVPVSMPLPPAPDSGSIFKIQKSGRARSAFVDPADLPKAAAAT
jgi:ectoine hydroxylase-related dioxygenase (phytanoyl-CoA dioxygenase family)